MVLIGVDPHKASRTAVVIGRDEPEPTALEQELQPQWAPMILMPFS
jgi:hypothetical protein